MFLQLKLWWLSRQLGNKSVETGSKARTALVQIGPPAVPTLITALKNDNKWLWAVLALGTIKDVRAVAPLCEFLRHGAFASHREAAAVALGEIGSPEAVDALGEALRSQRDGDLFLRQKSAVALGQIGDARAVPVLVEALCDKATDGDDVRPAVAEALQQLGWRPNNEHERILAALGRRDWDELQRIGSAAVEFVIEDLRPDWKRSFPSNAPDLARMLGRLGDARAIPILIEALKLADEDSIQGAAAEALAKLGEQPGRALVAALRELVRRDLIAAAKVEQHWRDRAANAIQRALIELGPAAAPALVAALTNTSSALRARARLTLETLRWRPATATERVQFAMARGQEGFGAAVSEGAIGIEPLVATLRVTSPYDRRAAANLLQVLGWEPQSSAERALFAAAREKFDEALAEGSAAAEALVLGLTHEQLPSRAEEHIARLVVLGEAAAEPLRRAYREGWFDSDAALSILNTVAPKAFADFSAELAAVPAFRKAMPPRLIANY